LKIAWAEQEYVLISAVEHYSYCPRQCALIHLESIYDENLLTLRGNRAHERVDQQTVRTERGRKVVRGMPIWSDEYGLVGKADAVEFEGDHVYPVEYKVGRNTGHKHALFQACAQAICLEEMFKVEIKSAAVYYVASKEREFYDLGEETRARTHQIIRDIRQMLMDQRTPEPVADKRCPKCSLNDACMPIAIRRATLNEQDLFKPRGAG
jgi:CRISPR-associated exonuclease Cas4